jgi:hypothetical protein
LAFLVLLIVATAIMFAWLLGSVSRFALSDLRLPGFRLGPTRPVRPRAGDVNAEAPAIVAAPEPVSAEQLPDNELDAERAVREHLNGRRERPA